MKKDAILDETRKYRYVLFRHWGVDEENIVNFVLLNPSKADENSDDPTIKACIVFAKKWGYDGICVTNLFAFRASRPDDLKKAMHPIGDKNDSFIQQCAKKSKMVVIGWGNEGNFLDRGRHVVELISSITLPHAFAILKNGSPQHPLYVDRETKLIAFEIDSTV